MKTSKFIQIIEDAGFEVNNGPFNITIYNEVNGAEIVLGTVSKVKMLKLSTWFNEFNVMPIETKMFLAVAMYKYALTPIKDRESIKLNEYERMILESLHRDYTKIGKLLSVSGAYLFVSDDTRGLTRRLDMFEELFDWVEVGKTYNIKDLLNG